MLVLKPLERLLKTSSQILLSLEQLVEHPEVAVEALEHNTGFKPYLYLRGLLIRSICSL
jgi:hypothetical protein